MPVLTRVLIEMSPFGGPDGLGPVLAPLLMRILIDMLPFAFANKIPNRNATIWGPDGQGPVLVPLLMKVFL